MADLITEIHGVKTLVCTADGPVISTEQHAVDLIADAHGRDAALVVLPVERLAPEFFQLRTGVAGAVAGKFATYRMRLAVLGDVSGHLARSETFASFVGETNRGSQLWFLPGRDELAARLSSG
jgi:hypothetical protein